MSASIARYLKDFGSPPPALVEQEQDFFAPDMSDFASEPEAPPVDIDAERADAHAKGREEAGEELRLQWEEERRALVEAHAAELAALKASLETELAEKIATQLQDYATAVARAVSDQAAAALAPVMDEAVVAKAVADLSDLLRAAMLDGEVGSVTVSGPLPMFEQLKEKMGEEAAVLKHVETSDPDLTIELGDASIVSRMSAWSASLRKVLE